jgi:hypothetical protein
VRLRAEGLHLRGGEIVELSIFEGDEYAVGEQLVC